MSKIRVKNIWSIVRYDSHDGQENTSATTSV